MKNPLGSLSTHSKITVSALPQFSKELSLSTCSSSVIESKINDYNVLSINQKSQIRIEGQISAKPTPTIKWFKGDVELKPNEKLKIENKFDLYLLTIKDFSPKDVGLYRIQAENSAGILVSKLYLDINTLPVVVQSLTNSQLTLSENNQNHEFIGSVKSKPKSEVFWFFNDKLIKSDDLKYLLSEEITNEEDLYIVKLKIKDLTVSDSGTFKFKCKNNVGEAYSSGTLTILKGQFFIEKLKTNIELKEKSEINLECKIQDSSPKSTITWFKDGTALTESKRFTISQPIHDQEKNITTFCLVIQDAVASDSGLYTFKSVSKITTIESNCEVAVFSAPRITKDLKPTIQAIMGDQVVLDINATARPEPEFKWYRLDSKNQEIEILPNETIKISRNKNVYSLTISKITPDFKGKYVLKLKNKFGCIETACNISAEGKKIKNILNIE